MVLVERGNTRGYRRPLTSALVCDCGTRFLAWLWGQERASCVQDGWHTGCCDGGLQIKFIVADFRENGWLEGYFPVHSPLLALRSHAGAGGSAGR